MTSLVRLARVTLEKEQGRYRSHGVGNDRDFPRPLGRFDAAA